MPCNDGYLPGYGPRSYYEPKESIELKKLSALTCGLFRFLISENYDLDEVFKNLDYKEMGLTQKYAKKWWLNHKKQDDKRMRN